MSNMSYCRFQNTTEAMQECITDLECNSFDLEHIKQKASSEDERQAMDQFVKLCKKIALDFK